ncbi:Uncharacterised protein [Mycobacteroides abscessus subsp. massiliense]|uniref:hypothetical protein n=1 Tax=Mycobacteroides abscessus TaxID=36809 RepID=UPI0009A5AFD5|nr:hypothetical protein [Mycobacteroides abscessus]SKH28460.1 Uncharacterised protein [Mycobacteroides abscessus subsp. massiliense]SKH51270.1 Uncharacterised protein [Mycobacteroides abscessus subsp. massiliense]SKI05598.1 Uncharacterised protein [Mycobacteroides abscessus subsp. massiliense]SKJ90257.1 Uncharacterised protein [Mycobacteroides abscessus subsp. massiliense]
MSLVYAAHRGSYEDFLKEYTPGDAVKLFGGGRPLLFQSVGNKDVEARVAITMRLLDDGADPSIAPDNVNVLHVLFDQRTHDAAYEAPMLRRLIEGGADINQFSKRSGPPLANLIKHGPSPESARVPFYDVIFDQPNLDLSRPYLHDLIFNSAWNLPLLRERALAYESARA